MSTITKDLGAVTAYAYAKEKGYTGTEAEFAELMASYATVAEQASQSAQTATEKASEASQSASDAQTAKTASETAQASAESARDDAESARDEAQQSATTASQKAQEASQSAQTASKKASEASQSATDAQTAKTASETAQGIAESARDDAESARDTASQSAQTASEKAQQASASATSASQSASTASASAQTAQTAQQTATAKASEAQQSATTASTKAQEASQSASESSQSAQTAVQAKQDAQTAKTASETAQASAESARDDAESARDEAQQYAESIDPEKLIGAYSVDTASGSIASFTDGADNIPMKSVKVRIEPVQDLHGQSSPYPPGGGKNLFDKNSVVNDESLMWINGAATSEQNSWISDFIPIIHNTSYISNYYLSQIFIYDENKNAILIFYNNTWKELSSTGGSSANVFTTPNEGSYLRFSCRRNVSTGTPAVSPELVQLELGSTTTDYVPYSNICPISGWDSVVVSHSGADRTNPTTKTITFPQTVYGGTLDVTTGELVVDMAMVEITRETPKGSYSATYNGVVAQVDDAFVDASDPSTQITADSMAVNTQRGYAPTISATYLIKTWGGKTGIDTKQFMLCGTWTNIEDFNAWLDLNPLHITYPLATPITVTLTPTEIKSLLGDNNLWADAGDSTVVYRADTTLYINRKIAEAVSALS